EQRLAVYREQRDEQAGPEQRQRDRVRQQLVVEVDQRQRKQRPGKAEGGRRLPGGAEGERDREAEQRRHGLDDRIPPRDRRAAARAAAAKQQVAQDRDVVLRLDRRGAARARGGRPRQIESFVRRQRRQCDGCGGARGRALLSSELRA